jgi:hypothetical protein
MVAYMLYATHGATAPRNPTGTVAAVQADLTGRVTAAYQGSTTRVGQIDQATCAPVGSLPGNLNCVVLLGGQPGAYEITVAVDTAGRWRQLCAPGDPVNGRLCAH